MADQQAESTDLEHNHQEEELDEESEEELVELRHLHQFMPMLSVPDDAEIITKKPKDEYIPTRKQFISMPPPILCVPVDETMDFSHCHRVAEDTGPLRDFRARVEPPSFETIIEAIDRVNRYHGQTNWKVNYYYRKDDESEWMNVLRESYFMTEEAEEGPMLHEHKHYVMPLQEWLFLLVEQNLPFLDLPTASPEASPTASPTASTAASTSLSSTVSPTTSPTHMLLRDMESHRLLTSLTAFKALAFVSQDQDPQLFYGLLDLIMEKSDILKNVTIDTDSKEECDVECGICKENYGEETKDSCGKPTKCKACPCKAHFGYYCLKEWVWDHGTCPNCRTEVD